MKKQRAGGIGGQAGELAAFTVAVIKYPGKRNLRKDGFLLVHSSKASHAGQGMARAFSSQSHGPVTWTNHMDPQSGSRAG